MGAANCLQFLGINWAGSFVLLQGYYTLAGMICAMVLSHFCSKQNKRWQIFLNIGYRNHHTIYISLTCRLPGHAGDDRHGERPEQLRGRDREPGNGRLEHEVR